MYFYIFWVKKFNSNMENRIRAPEGIISQMIQNIFFRMLTKVELNIYLCNLFLYTINKNMNHRSLLAFFLHTLKSPLILESRNVVESIKQL